MEPRLTAPRTTKRRRAEDELPATEAAQDGDEIAIEPASDYSAIQGEDSLDDDPMPVPGDRE